MKRKVLYVCHNHPSVRPGGAETYALELYEAMRETGEFEPILVSRMGGASPHPGTRFATLPNDGNQYFCYVDTSEFDLFTGHVRDKDVLTDSFHDLLMAHRPDIVHFQHTLFLGYDLIRQTRNTLPNTPIVYTLHEFLPICHHNGQMIRTHNSELCSEESPRRCNECFPQISPQAFFMRKRLIQSQFRHVDLFLTPSRFLRERYVAWGIPPDRIRYEPNGRLPVERVEEPAAVDRPRNRLGFFGQFSPYKGVHVLLEAMKLLGRSRQPSAAALTSRLLAIARDDRREVAVDDHDLEAHLWMHGANLEIQNGTFQNQVRTLLDETRENVTVVGRYGRAELPRLMANVDWVIVPSIWWENAPLVIQEAFQFGKPVICSDIGGMAEYVTDGVNGLHFRVGDPTSLARTIQRAIRTPGLWERLRAGIPEVYGLSTHVATLGKLYQSLLDRAAVHGG